jgi:hypothetical protein
MSVLEDIRARLHALGWTVAELAILTEISEARIQACLDGSAPGSEETMSEVVRVLGIQDSQHPIDDPHLSPEQRKGLGRALYRRALAERLASDDAALDASSIERVLANLELAPGERLARGLQRGRLRNHARR